MSGLAGRRFYKMSGSGNDFVVFDGRESPMDGLIDQGVIQRLCARGTGVGADGVAVLVNDPAADIGLRYYNADGLLASLCGNATLCVTNLATMLGGVDRSGFRIATDAGVVQARIRNGLPEFDFPTVTEVESSYQPIEKTPGESRLGYALAGVPHIVIQMDDVAQADPVGRGRPIRYDPSFKAGTNVNFVSKGPDGRWLIRTYERGVEDETLACGTGNVAAAILLNVWGEAGESVELITRSGSPLYVYLTKNPGGGWSPSLRGDGRLVFTGEIGDL